MSDRIFGIDLGTTNSCLAVMERAGPRVIPIDGEPIVPSVVSYDAKAGELIVGRRARNRQLLDPGATVRSIKRQMGERVTIDLGGRKLSPEEVAAEILRYLRVEGGKACGEEVRRAVVTVPAYFADAQRRATLRAGELAGLEVVRLLNEPTAAALVHDRLTLRGLDLGVDAARAERRQSTAARRDAAERDLERILVYDFGGGTFDVSVIEIRGEIDEVLASGGDTHLGGDDVDRRLADRLIAVVRERYGRDLSTDLRATARLTRAAEQAKIDLSTRPYARILEEAVVRGVNVDLELSRGQLEEMIADLLKRTLAEVDRALREARLVADDVDQVVLVGGSTRMPRVAALLEERFSCPVEHAVDPALAVALGAAIEGAVLTGEVCDHFLVDVAAHSVGVRTLSGLSLTPEGFGQFLDRDHFSVIIPRNTQIPVTRAEVYSTVVNEQEKVRVEVFQGESRRCSENTPIGDFIFDLEPAPAGSPVVTEIGYDLDGVLQVRLEQKGFDNSRLFTLDTRTRRSPAPEGAEEGAGELVGAVIDNGLAVDNYMIRKAHRLSRELPAGPLRSRLLQVAQEYETALGVEALDPGRVDRLEDDLLDALDEAEGALAGDES